ncbi:TPA: hypothetical protein ACGORP_000071 [Streptococcus suis]
MRKTAKEIVEEMKFEILKAIKESDFCFYGIRGWDEEYKIGQVLPESVKWDYDRDMPTDEEVGGTCVTITDSQFSDFKDWYETDEEMLEAIEKAIFLNQRQYCYPMMYLVGSNERNPRNAYEADENEAILAEATVIAKIY